MSEAVAEPKKLRAINYALGELGQWCAYKVIWRIHYRIFYALFLYLHFIHWCGTSIRTTFGSNDSPRYQIKVMLVWIVTKFSYLSILILSCLGCTSVFNCFAERWEGELSTWRQVPRIILTKSCNSFAMQFVWRSHLGEWNRRHW